MNAPDMKQILFLSFLRSKIPRENFEDIETYLKYVETELQNLSASTSTSEIISSRDGYPTLQDRLHSNFKHIGNGVVTENQLITDCDNVSGWTAGTGATAPAIETSQKIEGTGSLKLGKSGTASGTIEYIFDMADVALENKNIIFSLFVEDLVTLNVIQNIYLDITPDGSFSNYKRFNLTNFGTNWNKANFQINIPNSIVVTVNDDDVIQLIRIVINTVSPTDVFASGKVLVDFVYYNGDELRILESTTPALSVRVLAGGALINGFAQLKSSEGSILGFIAPSVNPRYDLVTIDINGVVAAWTGTEAAAPVDPKVPDNHTKLARIYHRVGSTSIKNIDDSTNSFIEDLRNILSDPEFFSNNYELILDVSNIYADVSLNSDETINHIDFKIGGSSGLIIATATYTYTAGEVTQIVTVMGAATYTRVITYNSKDEITNSVVTIT